MVIDRFCVLDIICKKGKKKREKMQLCLSLSRVFPIYSIFNTYNNKGNPTFFLSEIYVRERGERGRKNSKVR